MAGFTDLPREVRNKIYKHLIAIPNGLALIAAKVVEGNSQPTAGVVRDMASWNMNQTKLDEALNAYKTLRRVNSQLAQEVLAEFCFNNYLTIRVDISTTPIHTTQDGAVPSTLLLGFETIRLVAPRSAGYWPHLGGGPDLFIVVKTAHGSKQHSSKRQMVGGSALSADHGAAFAATAASRLSGRTWDESMFKTLIVVFKRSAQKA